MATVEEKEANGSLLLTSGFFIKNARVPPISWPSIFLLISCISMHLIVGSAHAFGSISSAATVALNSLSSYAAFTCMHDASHRSIATVASGFRWLNELVGILSSSLFPAPFYAFRHIHLQHHKHTNDSLHDPDAWVALGPKYLLPFRWMSIELKYYSIYVPLIFLAKRGKSEINATLLQLLAFAAIILCASASGLGHTVMMAWILPGRIAFFFLAYFFDYLPHHPHTKSRSEDPLSVTSIVSLYADVTWWLTWPLFHQNYHAIHHMAPHIPFYEYSTVWKSLEKALLEKGIKYNPIFEFPTQVRR